MIIYPLYINCVFLQLETIMFSQFMYKPAQAVTGVPVRTQGVPHVPVVDVRVPGFCRTQGTHLFYDRRVCEVSFVSLSSGKIYFYET